MAEVVNPPSSAPTSDGESRPDPELLALPAPRRPGRRLALATLTLTVVASVVMVVGLAGEAGFAVRSGPPVNVGELSGFEPGEELANAWVRGAGELGAEGAVEYTRPLERDAYRLAPVIGNPRLWVQVRVPSELDGARFVPPTTFVGRLLPLTSGGVRYSELRETLESVGGVALESGASVLIDGEAPASTRWALGLIALFLGFAGFGAYGLVRLLRPLQDA